MGWEVHFFVLFFAAYKEAPSSQYKASSFERKNMDVYARSLMVRSKSGACHLLLADPIGQNSVLWLL